MQDGGRRAYGEQHRRLRSAPRGHAGRCAAEGAGGPAGLRPDGHGLQFVPEGHRGRYAEGDRLCRAGDRARSGFRPRLCPEGLAAAGPREVPKELERGVGRDGGAGADRDPPRPLRRERPHPARLGARHARQERRGAGRDEPRAGAQSKLRRHLEHRRRHDVVPRQAGGRARRCATARSG